MCDCKTNIEEKLIERLKLKYPDASGHCATLEGYGFSVVGNTMSMRPFMPTLLSAEHANKKTGSKVRKKKRGLMGFNFCPFCGERLVASNNSSN